jgi:hypothetical protein
MEDLVRAISKLQTDLRGINTLHSYCNWSGDKCNVIFYEDNLNDIQGWVELYSTSEDARPEFIVLNAINNSYKNYIKFFINNFYKFIKFICLNNSNAVNLVDRSIELKDVNKIISKLTVNNYNLWNESRKYNL